MPLVRRLDIFSRPLDIVALRQHDRAVMFADFKSLPSNFPQAR